MANNANKKQTLLFSQWFCWVGLSQLVVGWRVKGWWLEVFDRNRQRDLLYKLGKSGKTFNWICRRLPNQQRVLFCLLCVAKFWCVTTTFVWPTPRPFVRDTNFCLFPCHTNKPTNTQHSVIHSVTSVRYPCRLNMRWNKCWLGCKVCLNVGL